MKVQAWRGDLPDKTIDITQPTDLVFPIVNAQDSFVWMDLANTFNSATSPLAIIDLSKPISTHHI